MFKDDLLTLRNKGAVHMNVKGTITNLILSYRLRGSSSVVNDVTRSMIVSHSLYPIPQRRLARPRGVGLVQQSTIMTGPVSTRM